MQPALDLDNAHRFPETGTGESTGYDTDDPTVDLAGESPDLGSSGPFRLATLDAIESDIGGVASAIEALDNGTYGRCGFCGTEIDAAELSGDPLATRCIAHR